MADALTERTARLLADYLEYCAREPGTAGRPPSTPEASVLRSVAAQVQQRNHQFLSQYRDYRGNRVELVAQTARELAGDRGVLSWGRVVALVTFAGTLLERTPRGTDGCPKPGPRREADVDPDCRSMVALLCGWLSGQHSAWLEASGGWDGFCRFFTPMLPSPWRRGLAQVLLSGFMAAMLVYFWKKSLYLLLRIFQVMRKTDQQHTDGKQDQEGADWGLGKLASVPTWFPPSQPQNVP